MIVAVTGGKGGVGKSTVAFALAAAVDAVLVDADLAMADLPAGRGPDLHDVLADRATPTEAVGDCNGVPVLSCGRSLAGARAATVTALPDALAPLERDHETVVVDCPAGLRADAGAPLAAAGVAVLVTRPTPAALSDAVRVRELARTFDAALLRVVCNCAPPDAPLDGIAALLGAPARRLPECRALADVLVAGRPPGARNPPDAVQRTLADLADAVRAARGPGPV